MSKLSFRARQLDSNKPLPVYRVEELPDLTELSTINRAVPQMPTGMEKEEETVSYLFINWAEIDNNIEKPHFILIACIWFAMHYFIYYFWIFKQVFVGKVALFWICKVTWPTHLRRKWMIYELKSRAEISKSHLRYSIWKISTLGCYTYLLTIVKLVFWPEIMIYVAWTVFCDKFA